MPFVVTDNDVLAQIATDDGLAASVDAALAKLPATPAATMAAWKARYAGYQAWATAARADLSGGFFGGAWFGVPNLGNQAIAWADEFGTGTDGKSGWQTIVNQIAAGQAPTMVAAAPVSQQDVANKNATPPPGLMLDGSTKFLIGAGIAVVALSLIAPHIPHMGKSR